MSQEIAALQVVIEAQTAAFTKGIQEAQAQLQKLNTTAQNSSQGISKISSVFTGISGVMLKFNIATQAVSTAFGILSSGANKLQSFVYAADSARKLQKALAELFPTSGGMERAADLMKRFYDVAQNGDLSLKQAAKSMESLAKATKDLGLSNEELQKITTTFFQMGKIGNKSAEEMAGSWNQFTIALQRGEIAAGQLNRMLRTSPELVQGLAKALNTSQAGLQRMASNGQLTADVITKAFVKMSAETQKKFDELPKTFDEGMEQLGRQMENFGKNMSKAIFGGDENGLGQAIGVYFENFNKEFEKLLNFIVKTTKTIMPYVLKTFDSLGAILSDVGKIIGWVIDGISDAMNSTSEWAGVWKVLLAPITVFKFLLEEVLFNYRNIRNAALEAYAAAMDFASLGGNIKSLKDHANAVREMVAAYKADEAATAKKLEAAKAIKDYGNAAEKSVDQLTKAGKAMRAWQDSLTKAREEFELIPGKMKILEDMISKLNGAAEGTADFVFLEKLKKDLESLKAQMAAGNPLELFRLELEKIAETRGVSATTRIEEISDAIRNLGIAGKLTEENAKALTKSLDEAFKQERIEKLGPEIASLSDQIDAQARSFDMVAEKIKFVNQEIQNMVAQGVPEDNQMLKYLRNMSEEMTKTKDSGVKDFLELRDAVAGFSSQFANEFVNNLMQGKIAFDGFAKGLLDTIVKTMMNQMVTKFITSFMGGGGTAFGSSFLGGLFKSANGNAFMSGLGLPYGIYDKPTFFEMPNSGAIQKFAKGGVLGEAGPEAIMPLTRGRDGKLGVEATGGSTVINVINNAGVEVSTAENTGNDGSKIIDITIEKKVKEMFASGSMDKTMRAGYGLQRSAT